VIEAFSAVRFRLSARGKEKFDKSIPPQHLIIGSGSRCLYYEFSEIR